MRNLNLDQLQTLIAIADLGTFAAAAQALHLAPPTVSLHINRPWWSRAASCWPPATI